MSDFDDYDTEMFQRHPLDDAAIEAFFTGHPAAEESASLVGFVEDLQTLASGPVPVPSAQLVAMMAAGFSTEHGDLAHVTELSKWRKKKMIIGEFILGLGVAAKATFGVSMAAAAVTAGGAAGVLPGPAQHTVAVAVDAVTPFSFPDKANAKANFGGEVSTDARDGGVDGKTISSEAKLKGETNRPTDTGRPEDAGRPDDTGRPAAPGQKGLDQANTTPAAGRVPTSVPFGKPDTVGKPTTTGSVTTETSSGIPETAGTQSTAGLTTAGSTPAAGRVPTAIPSARPVGRP